MTLTNTAIDAMFPGDVLKDDKVPGLSVRAHKGSKAFMLYFRTKGGIERRPKLGDYGKHLTLAQAREVARNMLVRVANGEDPIADREAQRAEPTMDELWDRCAKEHYTRKDGWHKEAKRIYHANLKSKLGSKRVGRIQFEDIDGLYRAMSGRPSEANHTVAVFSKMMQLAEKWRYRPQGTNPARLLDNRYANRKRRRFATPVELAKLGPILDRYAEKYPASVAFLYVLAFTGARPSEIGRATPDILEAVKIDGNRYGVLRIDEGKTGYREVFLPPQAMRVLDRLPAKRKTLTGREQVPKNLWATIRDEAGCGDLWARDFRRTFATVGLSNGITLGQIGELLGHQSTQTTQVYAKLMADPAMRASAQIAGQVEALMGGEK